MRYNSHFVIPPPPSFLSFYYLKETLFTLKNIFSSQTDNSEKEEEEGETEFLLEMHMLAVFYH